MSYQLQIGVILMIATILSVAVLLLASQEKPANINQEPYSGPIKQLAIFNANNPLQGSIVMLGIVGAGSGLSFLLVRFYF